MIFRPKHPKFFALLAAAALLAGIALWYLKSPEDAWLCQNGQWVQHGKPSSVRPQTGCGQEEFVGQNSENLSYIIEGQAIKLQNGLASAQDGAGGSITTKIFSITPGDINGDGLEDSAVMITQDRGGSGTFFYAAVAINNGKGFVGSNAVLLGDRIAPQNLEIKNGLLIANYAERKAGESFTVPPSVGVSKYMELQGYFLFARPEAMRLFSPRPNDEIFSPLKISGQARGSWFFEGSFPVMLVDWDGRIIAQGIARAKSEWMTQEFVPFEAEMEFKKPEYKNNGSLILKKDNPSGLPQNDDALEIPVYFK